MHFFPNPYNDEILYSVLARYSVRCGIISHKTIIEGIFGKASARAVMELPFNINGLISNLPVNSPYTGDIFIYNHTLYTFFTAFLPPERAEEIKCLMLEESGGSKAYGKAGILGSRLPLNEYMKFCPKCFEEDTAQYGEGYWHRIHQVPFIMACPLHETLLYDSTVLVRGHNPQAYIPANGDNCRVNELPYYKPDTIKKFINISKDVQNLLESSFPNKPFTWFAKQYVERFKELEYANINGRVYWDDLVQDFKDFYGEEFLNAMQSNVEDKGQGQWIREVTHSDAKAMHPIRHLLLARFLGLSLDTLFNKEICYKPFGDGPWLCLNPAADHFLEPVIKDAEIKYRRRNKNTNGFFRCCCGFEYMRSVSRKQGERVIGGESTGIRDKGVGSKDREAGCEEQGRFVRVVKYGHVWEEKVLELIDEGVSDEEIAVRLNADVRKIRGFNRGKGDRSKDERSKGEGVKDTRIIEILDNSIDFIVKRQKYRDEWLRVVGENPDKGRVELRRLGKYTCTWLCRNDREWWEKNTPAKKYVQADNTVDWEIRDKEILQHVKQTVQEILDSEEKPQRISLRLIKTRSGLKSFDLQLDKLPLTKAFIDSAIETPMDLHKRRIQWAIDKLNEEGKALTITNITTMTGVGNKYRKQVVEEVKRALGELGER